jgi:hypothetical protein
MQICIAFLFEQLGASVEDRCFRGFQLSAIPAGFDYPLLCSRISALYTDAVGMCFCSHVSTEEHYILSQDIKQMTTLLLTSGKHPLQLDLMAVNCLLRGYLSPADFPLSFMDEIKTIEHQV